MKNIVAGIVTVGIISMLSAGFASAQTQMAPAGTPGPFANVKNLRPFTAETAYMSLAGYFRYVTHQQTDQWLTRLEAERIVRQ